MSRLYATVTGDKMTGEAITKGQGGQKRLDISLTVGDKREEAGVISVREVEKGIFNIAYYHNGQASHIARIETKGEKQKGEYCPECMSTPCGQE